MFVKPKMQEVNTLLRPDQAAQSAAIGEALEISRAEVLRILFDLGFRYVRECDPPMIEGAAQFWEAARFVLGEEK